MDQEGFAQKSVSKKSKPAREAGDSIKPGVERSGNPRNRELKDHSPRERATAQDHDKRCRPPAGGFVFGPLTWGSAALHPAFMLVARFPAETVISP